MTKHEILDKHMNVDVSKSNYPNGYPYITEAMSEYAKQEGIELITFLQSDERLIEDEGDANKLYELFLNRNK